MPPHLYNVNAACAYPGLTFVPGTCLPTTITIGAASNNPRFTTMYHGPESWVLLTINSRLEIRIPRSAALELAAAIVESADW